ncbi:MAG TPA: tonB-system energizer ExbB [Xanthobacteraceae bacterium]|nr:tonB-system energizer ExbB [Xanthobacteraceae bacterium]
MFRNRFAWLLAFVVAFTPAAFAQTAQPSAPEAPATTAPAPRSVAPAVPPASAVQPPEPQPLTTNARVPRELSPWSMFLSADILVQAVMVSLAFASLVTWTILLAKTLQLSLARRRVNKALAVLGKARTLAEAQLALGQGRSVVSALLAGAVNEVRLSSDALTESGVKERAESRFAEILRAEARAARVGMGTLATIGSTAPFVGLFGTVWGIMNSFIGISKAQTTNLAVVAPGIAEALLATAIGLVAAIPAVIFYNHFARQSKSYLELVSRAAGAVGRLLSRDLDRAGRGIAARAAE